MKWNAETIKAARRAANVTQAEFSDELGTRQQTISEWERGLYVPGQAYQKLITIAFENIMKRKEKPCSPSS